MAITLRWIMRSMPAMPMAESRPPMVVGIRQTSSATSTVMVIGCPGRRRDAVERVGQQRGAHEQEDDGEAGQQDVERDLVGRLLALGALHQADHAVQESFAGVGGDAHHQPVREHARAAGHGAAVAADSRITGALSPVTALSSTEAMPSMTSPSAGMMSPASTRTTSSRRRAVEGTRCRCPASCARQRS